MTIPITPENFTNADAFIESLLAPPKINKLRKMHDIPSIAIDSLGAYVMGAQTPSMQFALREGQPVPTRS